MMPLTWNPQSDGVLSQEHISNVRSTYKTHLESELARVPSYAPRISADAHMLQNQWKGIVWPANTEARSSVDLNTGVEKDVLKCVGKASVWVPEDFEIHSKLARHVKNRLGSLEKEKGLDWATAEVSEIPDIRSVGFQKMTIFFFTV
jgi:probable 2-oxoglutarate dehydrogenase E1 component DHKTD1